MSNSSYAKTLDTARFEFALVTFLNVFHAGGWVPLGGAFFSFLFGSCAFSACPPATFAPFLVFRLSVIWPITHRNKLKPNPPPATHYHFIREIPVFARYEIQTVIGAWDDKWVRYSILITLRWVNLHCKLDLHPPSKPRPLISLASNASRISATPLCLLLPVPFLIPVASLSAFFSFSDLLASLHRYTSH
jgi:hypothetical protein